MIPEYENIGQCFNDLAILRIRAVDFGSEAAIIYRDFDGLNHMRMYDAEALNKMAAVANSGYKIFVYEVDPEKYDIGFYIIGVKAKLLEYVNLNITGMLSDSTTTNALEELFAGTEIEKQVFEKTILVRAQIKIEEAHG